MSPPYIYFGNSVGTAHIFVRKIGNAGNQLGGHGQCQQGPDGVPVKWMIIRQAL